MYLEKLKESFDIEQLIFEVNHLIDIHSLYHNQLSLNHRHGFENEQWFDGCGSPYIKDGTTEGAPRFIDTDFNILNAGLESTEIGNVYNTFKDLYKLGRYRIVCLKPKSCYGWHKDLEKRIQIPVITNPGSFIITEGARASHLPATGEAWLFDANDCYHTALNSSYNQTRIHLLLNIWS